MLLRLSIPPETDEQKQLLAERRVKIHCRAGLRRAIAGSRHQGLDAEGHISIDYTESVKVAGGPTCILRKPGLQLSPISSSGRCIPKTMMSPRMAPPMIGLGLLEAIPEADDSRPRRSRTINDGDGFLAASTKSGRSSKARRCSAASAGRPASPTVRQQSADAFAGDIGISTPLVPKPAGDCTQAQAACLDAPNGNSARQDGVEVGTELFDLVVILCAESRRAARGAIRPARGCSRQGACSQARLRQVPHAVAHDGRRRGQAASQQPDDLALHRSPAARHGRGPRRQPPRRPCRWARMAHAAAVGHRPDRKPSAATRSSCTTAARAISRKRSCGTAAKPKARDGYTKLGKRDRDALIVFLKSL